LPETDTTVSGKTRNWYVLSRNNCFWKQKILWRLVYGRLQWDF